MAVRAVGNATPGSSIIGNVRGPCWRIEVGFTISFGGRMTCLAYFMLDEMIMVGWVVDERVDILEGERKDGTTNA